MWVFDLFSHFRPQYPVLAAVLCLGALAFRAYSIAAVLATIALVHAWAIKDLWLGGSAAVASGAEPLRVARANVLSSNSEAEKALDFVQTSDADVVVLVEAQGEQWRDALSAIGADCPHRAPEGLTGQHSRHPCSAVILSFERP